MSSGSLAMTWSAPSWFTRNRSPGRRRCTSSPTRKPGADQARFQDRGAGLQEVVPSMSFTRLEVPVTIAAAEAPANDGIKARLAEKPPRPDDRPRPRQS